MGPAGIFPRHRLYYAFIVFALVLGALSPPVAASPATASPTARALCPTIPGKASTPGAVCGNELAPSGPGVAPLANLPKGASLCPSTPGKRASGPGAACSDKTPRSPSNAQGIVRLPAGHAQCASANGKNATAGSACWKASTATQPSSQKGKISLPPGATRCANDGIKVSSDTAACGDNPSPASNVPVVAKVALPAGLAPCPSTKTKKSSPYVACALGVAPALSGWSAGREATLPFDIAGYSISLYTSANYLGVGRGITLSAYANRDVGPTPYYIEFYDASTGGQIGYCAWGSSCSTSVSMGGATTHWFVAYVGSWSGSNPPGTVAATSNSVAVTWMAITGLSASPQYLAPNSATTITVYSSADVGPRPYYLEVFDASTGAVLAICARGTSCSASETQYAATTHTFYAYISSYGTTITPPNSQSSASVSAFWLTVSISASPTALAPGGTTTLVASTTADVGPSPYYISIFDTTTNTRVALCPSGTYCSANFTSNASTIRDFFAYIGSNRTSAPPTPVLVSSLTYAEVTWITITLQVTPPLVAVNASTTLTAYASVSVTNTPYYIQLYDQSAQTFITQCPSGSSCSTSVSQPVATTHAFIAYVNCCGTAWAPPSPRATSSPANGSWVSVAVRACNYSVPSCPSVSWTNGTVVNSAVTLMATASLDVTNTGYSIQFVDQASGQVVGQCPGGSSCASGVSKPVAGTYSWVARVAVPNSYPPAVSGQSSPLSLIWVQAWKPWLRGNDTSTSGFGGSSQFDYSDDPNGGQQEYGIDVGLVSLRSGSAIYAPEPGNVTYVPCPTGTCWHPGRVWLKLDSGVVIGFGHVNAVGPFPRHVNGGEQIATVACNTNVNACDNSHVEFMYNYLGDITNWQSFRPPASATAPVTSYNGCPRNTYTTSGGTSVDPCAWLSAYLLNGI
jgi:hypothetical protein